jgi:hypothetical protein
MWSSWVMRKGTTQVMYIVKLKDGPERSKKTFSMILERAFEMVWWRGRKWNHIKKDLKCFAPLKILTSPFIWGNYWSFFFFFLFSFSFSTFFFLFSFFFLCSVSWGLGGFYDIWGENHFFKNHFSNGMTWNGVVMTMDILAVDAYSGIELCMPI